MEVSQKIKARTTILPYDSAIAFGCIAERNEITIMKRYLHSTFIAALFTMAKAYKQPKCSSWDKWIRKYNNYICMCRMDYYLAKKCKKWNLI